MNRTTEAQKLIAKTNGQATASTSAHTVGIAVDFENCSIEGKRDERFKLYYQKENGTRSEVTGKDVIDK